MERGTRRTFPTTKPASLMADSTTLSSLIEDFDQLGSHLVLFNYNQPDDSKLGLKKDEVVRVLRKAENGWWFPSNYVGPIADSPSQVNRPLPLRCETDDGQIYIVDQATGLTRWEGRSPAPRSSDYPTPSSAYISFPSTSTLVQPETIAIDDSSERLPPNWKRIQTSDGKTMYFNPESKEMQWNLPGSLPSKPFVAETHVADLRTNSQLPSNWGVKTSPDGRTYYFNYRTDQTTWRLEDIDITTAELTAPPISLTSTSQQITTLSHITYPHPSHSNPWKPLMDPIIESISTFTSLAVSNQKEKYIPQSTVLVESVRFLLLASINPHRETPAPIKTLHRAIMASLSKLVVDAKLACCVWPPPDARENMCKSAVEILGAVREFVVAAMGMGVVVDAGEVRKADELRKLKAPVEDESMSSSKPSNSEIVSGLEQHVLAIRSRAADILALLQPNAFEPPKQALLADITLLIGVVGNFLDSVEDQITADQVSPTLILEFGERQVAINSAVTELMSMASVSSSDYPPPNVVQDIILGVQNVVREASDLLVTLKFMIQEKESWERGPISEPIAIPPTTTRSPIVSPLPTTRQHHLSLPAPIVKIPQTSPFGLRRMSTTESLKSDKSESGSFARAAKSFGIEGLLSAQSHGETLELSPISKHPLTRLPSVKAAEAWYLKHDYADSDIAFNADGSVKGGVLEALVERLTLHNGSDVSYMQSFLLTYRSITDSETLFRLIKDRFCIAPPVGLSEDEIADWESHKKYFIQLRVLNVLKSWLENYFYDEDAGVLFEIKEFAVTKMMLETPMLGRQLLKFVERRQEKGSKTLVRAFTAVPPPILPRTLKTFSFLDLDSIEVARQLTILESSVYCRIQPVELLKKAWGREEGVLSPNVKEMINHSNQIAGWVVKTILLERDAKKRALVVKQFILIAEKCRILNNFCTLTTIISALNSSSIYRLKRTWEFVGKTAAKLDSLKALMSRDKNFGLYRDALHTANPPCVPYFGLFLTDLTFIEDGSSDFLQPLSTEGDATDATSLSKLINFFKRTKTAEVIRDIQQFQNEPYQLYSVKEIQEFLQSGFANGMEEQVCFAISMELEPREREDEQVARMLAESGFL
ncbi:hypothetical protein HDU98_007303 [Podochytrium sp. JEL0797]|nr:hypothetical protein HDU98_007303 [Podochytrium sp. JEL0797]